MAYLVAFVADPARDEHADALRELARGLPGAGFFDDPDGGLPRTVGTYARVETLADGLARALLRHVGELSGRLRVRIEVQYEERILGHLVAGEPDDALATALSGRG
ncbi:MAG: hypothetical protein IRZ32_11485 [Solirubrobacteraceae bacterium]|nr:hypothetical protein [Solirubrobacteraceae bacterium]